MQKRGQTTIFIILGIVILLIINLILLFVGIFMDMTPAVLIFTPIFLPVVVDIGMDPIHFGSFRHSHNLFNGQE